jgi:hypothetical protein
VLEPEPVLVLAELPVESFAEPVDAGSAPVELLLVDADTLVIAGPVENPGGEASPQAARTRAARTGVRIAPQAYSCLHPMSARNRPY